MPSSAECLGGLRRDEKRELRQASGGWWTRSLKRNDAPDQGLARGPVLTEGRE